MMNNNDVIFETKVSPKEGMPYLPTKMRIRFIMTQNEIRLIDPKWEYVIPFSRIFNCISRAEKYKTVVYAVYTAPSEVEVTSNLITVDFLNENNKRVLLRSIISKYWRNVKNVPESIRFNETVEKYRLRDKFRKDTMPENEK